MDCRVTLSQINPTLGNLQKNFELHVAEIEVAKQAGSQLVLFPELSLSGYFLAARDALGADGTPPDSIVVAFGESSRRWNATIASVSRAKSLDVVVLQLRDYDGPHLRRMDWAGSRGGVNEPAAIIGHSVGEIAARPGVSAAIISRSAPDRMRLEVFGTPSSNGSPVFAASGEVIGILQLALPREGVVYAARLYRVVPILPSALQAELGIRP